MKYGTAEYRVERINGFLDLLWGEMYAMPNDAPEEDLEKIEKRFREMEIFARQAIDYSRICRGETRAA